MPTYVYECSKCGNSFEAEQRMSDAPLDKCHCGSKGTVRRVIQPTGVMFRGSGFHINDYAANSVPPPESCNGEPASCPACSPEKQD